MQTITIAGVGLIGASFGLAIRKAGFAGEIFGVSSPSSLATGIAIGAVDRGVPLEDAARHSDLFYLAQPIDQILQTLPRLHGILKTGCLVTDAGSTKTVISQTARTCLPPNTFLGGHPMAGKERRGATAAEADLFRNRAYVLTGANQISNPHVPEFRTYLEKMGAQIVEMTPEEHDHGVALTSHLPQLLSTALAAAIAEATKGQRPRIFGPGLIDMTRLALSSADIWKGILSTNQAAVSEALTLFERTLQGLRESMAKETITELFEEGSKFADSIRRSDNNF